mmetsp:Transcript_9216/g.22921  ORF Transcript_9216/g.22921 Transcript_9216/m.22921 type:complete len:86 (+) Transcript_9216:105-362(+)
MLLDARVGVYASVDNDCSRAIPAAMFSPMQVRFLECIKQGKIILKPFAVQFATVQPLNPMYSAMPQDRQGCLRVEAFQSRPPRPR